MSQSVSQSVSEGGEKREGEGGNTMCHCVIYNTELLYNHIIYIFGGIHRQFLYKRALFEVHFDVTQIGPFGPMNNVYKLH